MNMFNNIKKDGFTLAELLITLAIIGVIAVMTLPTLMNGVQKAIAISQVKRTFAIISTTTRMAEADYGSASTWKMKDGSSWDSAKYFAETYMVPYLKVVKRCASGNNEADCNYNMYGLNGSNFTFEKSKTYRFYLVDGTFMAVYANQNLNSNGHRKQVTILFDTNGPKGANKLGNDIYKLEYMIESLKKPKQYIGKILPQYVDYKRTDLLSNKNEMCNKNQNGVACLSLIYNDGWVFAKDYPW